MPESIPETIDVLVALIARLVSAWCNELTNNDRAAWKLQSAYGTSGFILFLKIGLFTGKVPECK